MNSEVQWRFAKVFSAKIYFQAMIYRVSGRGALGYRKFMKVFFSKVTHFTVFLLFPGSLTFVQ